MATETRIDLTTGGPGATPPEPTIGELVKEIASDMSLLVRQEVELAKAEVKQEAAKAGKGAGMLGAAGFAGSMTLVLLSLAAVFGIGSETGLGWAALIVAAVWAVVGGILTAAGRTQLRRVHPKPERTVETLKEDARWARHPIS